MSQTAFTILAAIILVGLALVALSIGLIIRGKPITRGTCGYDPTKKKDGSCEKQGSCKVCGKSDSRDEEDA